MLVWPWAGHSENTQRAPRLSSTQVDPKAAQSPWESAPLLQSPRVLLLTQMLVWPWAGHPENTQRAPRLSSTQVAPKTAQSPVPQSALVITVPLQLGVHP